jgi:1-acyl-sn-glycerol-3-phosphate acyltransferase
VARLLNTHDSELRTTRIPPYHWWRTVFFLIPAISIYTIVLGAASLASSVFDRRGYFAHGCARSWSWLILKTTGVRVRVEGLGRIVPGTTYVFVSNHQSIYDIPVIFASLPYQLRIIAKQSLSKFPVLGWHLRRGGHLFVDRQNPDRPGILRRWRELVAEGLSLIIFAEGTRSPDGHVARFKAGSFLLAIEAGLPIVPVADVGTRAVMPKGRLRTEPADVTLVVLDPIDSPALASPTIQDARQLAERVQSLVATIVEKRQFAAVPHPAPRT